jgi:cell division protein FtsW
VSKEIYRRYGFDKLLFLAVIGMIAFGLVMVFSSSAPRGIEERGNSFYYFLHQVIGAVTGLALLLCIMSWSRPFYQNPIFVYGLLTLTTGMLALALVMPAIRNANRWIHFGGFRFQPSELAKISLVLFLAYYLDRKKDSLKDIRTLALPLGVICVVLLLVFKEPDVSTAILIGVICAVMLFLGGVRLSHLFALGVGASALLGAIFLQAPAYVRERIFSFISPNSSLHDAGYQAYQSKLALGSGGIFGSSIGQSSRKLYFLPDAHTDYIYSIVGEELGFIGAMGVLFLFGIFIWRGLVISRRAPDPFSRILAAGLTLTIGIQALLNISIALGLAPTTGLPLPLFSYGRSSLICTLFAMGILLHISQRKTTQRRK